MKIKKCKFLLLVLLTIITQNVRLVSQINKCITSLEVHPNDTDFGEGHKGKILISGQSYYSPYQKKDGMIDIEVDLPKEFVNQLIYFRLVDPDDPSLFDLNQIGDDNMGKNAKVNPSMVKASVNGQKVTAKTILEFGSMNVASGDNYIIEASTAPFTANNPDAMIGRTILLTAWKQLHFELGYSYLKGSYSTSNIEKNTTQSTLNVSVGANLTVEDDGTGLHTNTQIRIINPDGSSFLSNIISVSVTFNSITIQNNGEIIQQYAAIVPVSDQSVYSINPTYFPKAFSQECDGSTGGAFVEFINTGNKKIPNFRFDIHKTEPPGQDPSSNVPKVYLKKFISFAQKWNSNKALIHDNNVFFVVGGNGKVNGINYHPKAEVQKNIIFLSTLGDFGGIDVKQWNETFAHELGHTFWVSSPHIDDNGTNPVVKVPNGYCDSKRCLMAHLRSWQTEDSLFDVVKDGCIHDIRKAKDKR